MAATIKIKNSSTTGAVPTASDLVQGELAVNVADLGLYTENASGTIVKLNAPSIDDKNTGATKHVTISTDGHLGLGVTPSAWTTFKALELTGGAIAGIATNQFDVMHNAYYDGSFRYKTTGATALYQQAGAQHIWSYAASGTAGNAITFTQAMTLDASGRLGIGITSPGSGQGMVQVAGAGQSWFKFYDSSAGWNFGTFYKANGTTALAYIGGGGGSAIAGGTVDDFVVRAESNLLFAAGGSTERARIDSSGALLCGSTSWLSGASYKSGGVQIGGSTYAGLFGQTGGTVRYGLQYDAANTYLAVTSGGTFYVYNTANGVYLSANATSWTANSDERLKDIIEPITNAASKVSSLRAVIGKYKTDEEGTRRSFLIAQDVQAVLPEAVTQSQSKDQEQSYLGVQYTDVIPLLVAAIKELKAEIDTLKGQA